MKVTHLAVLLTTCSMALACGDDEDAETIQGVCVRDDSQGNFCITYTEAPASNASAIASGCSNDFGGTWTADGSCPSGTLVGTCTLSGDATGGAQSAVLQVFTPTDASTGENDICGSDGTWVAAP